MFNPSTHPQVTYSLTELSNALYRLMRRQRFDAITVTQLCREAQIARRTFYRNCQSMEDLVDYAICLQVRHLLESVDFSSREAPVLYQNFFQYWLDRREFLAITLSQGFFSRFYRQFTQYCVGAMEYPFLSDFLQGQENPESLRLFHNAFIIGGLCNVLERWTAEDFRTSIAALVCTLNVFVPACS